MFGGAKIADRAPLVVIQDRVLGVLVLLPCSRAAGGRRRRPSSSRRPSRSTASTPRPVRISSRRSLRSCGFGGRAARRARRRRRSRRRGEWHGRARVLAGRVSLTSSLMRSKCARPLRATRGRAAGGPRGRRQSLAAASSPAGRGRRESSIRPRWTAAGALRQPAAERLRGSPATRSTRLPAGELERKLAARPPAAGQARASTRPRPTSTSATRSSCASCASSRTSGTWWS